MNSPKILKAIGLNIRTAREKAGMTQEALAELVDVHWKTIGYIEGGYRDFGAATLARIALILNIPTGCIFERVTLEERRDTALITKATARKRKTKAVKANPKNKTIIRHKRRIS